MDWFHVHEFDSLIWFKVSCLLTDSSEPSICTITDITYEFLFFFKVFTFLEKIFCWCLNWLLKMATGGKTFCDAEFSHVSDHSRWMEELPDRQRDIPLNQLAIPGGRIYYTFKDADPTNY